MKRSFHLSGPVLACLGFLFALSLCRAEAAPQLPDLSLEGLPATFRLLPPRPQIFWLSDFIYNPVSDRYVAFFIKKTVSGDGIYSRLYNSKGRPVSAFYPITEESPQSLGNCSLAYNPKDNVFLAVGTGRSYDDIIGLDLDGNGRLRGQGASFTIKKQTGKYSADDVAAVWVPGAGKFAVTWTQYPYSGPRETRSGNFLALVDRTFKKVLGPKKVRSQDRYGNARPLDDKLLWGSSEAAGNGERPVVWFTDFKGRVLTSYGDNGFIYPRPAMTGGVAEVYSALDPDHGTVFLYWTDADSFSQSDWAYSEIQYRMMSTGGKFMTPVYKMPKKAPHQPFLCPLYVPEEKRFFLVANEYLVIHSNYPKRIFFGGKLWGYYLDEKGRIQDKKGHFLVDPIPLIRTVLDPTLSMFVGPVAYRSPNKSCFITYHLARSNPPGDESWGLIYK
jgi:hypothetical protein